MAIVASIDIGTNTVLCLVAEVSGGVLKKVIFEGLRTVRLGEGVDKNRAFSKAALERLDSALTEFAAECRKLNVSSQVVVATSATRDVTNREEFETIVSSHGFRAIVLTGDQEAQYTFTGAFTSPPKGLSAVIDVGGGSTEITIGTAGGIVNKKSFNIGTVRLVERFISVWPELDSELKKCEQLAAETFSELEHWDLSKITQVIAVAGTPTSLAAIELKKTFDREVIEGFKLTSSKLTELGFRLKRLNIEQRSELSGLDRGRTDVIVVGALILNHALSALKKDEIIVSTRGLRYGTIVDEKLWVSFK